MLISEYVLIKWNSNNIKYYKEKGYIYTKMKDSFLVQIKDLPDNSHVSVTVKCDYCGEIFEKKWYHYVKSINNEYIQKDCCKKCCNKKNNEVINKKYKVNNICKIEGVKEKTIITNIEKYGVPNVFMSEIIKEKIVDTNIKKYGCENPMQNDEIKNKVKNTCLEKYNVPCYLNLDYSGEKIKGKNSPCWKGGIRTERTERLTEEYKNWRFAVFTRDCFICVKCQQKKNKINAHHILNWKDNKEERYDISNGITLCEDCHNAFHKIFGKRNNNLEQLITFLEYDKNLC